MVNGPQRTTKVTVARSTLASRPLGAIKDTSSSSGKVFAKPTKEWVVPERTKPGRKISAEEPDNVSVPLSQVLAKHFICSIRERADTSQKRQSQNRQSQRAHRARRTDYVSTLEERLRAYEADEIHSNVRLQEVARALKADNERLKREIGEVKAENEGLREEGARLRRDMSATLGGKRSQVVSAEHKPEIIGPSSRPSRRSVKPMSPPVQRSKADRKAIIDCPICPDPDPDCPCQQGSSASKFRSASPSATSLATLSLAAKAIEEHEPTLSSHRLVTQDGRCGVCQSEEDCLCRILDAPALAAPIEDHRAQHVDGADGVRAKIEMKVTQDECGLCTSSTFCACKITSSPEQRIASSFGIASGSTALPLRRTRPQASLKKRVWDLDGGIENRIEDPSPSTRDTILDPHSATASCSGDPSNCEACRNDAFGKSHLALIRLQSIMGRALIRRAQARNSVQTSTLTHDCDSHVKIVPETA